MSYLDCFTISKHSDGTNFVHLIDSAPEALRELVRSIHFEHFFECFPNGWVYHTIYSAFEELALDDLDNITIEADIYNTELTTWLNDNCNLFAHEYCNEILEQGMQFKDIMGIISSAQQMAKTRIYESVNDFLCNHKRIKNDYT